MLKHVVDAGVPVLVFLAMAVVGTELAAADFRRVARQPWAVAAAMVGQCTLLPILGWLLVRCLDLRSALAPGVFLLVFATANSLAQVPILVAAVLVFRRTRVARGIHLVGADHR